MISEQIIDVLDEICKRFGIAIDWSKDNILPYIQELSQKIINYDLVVNCLLVILSLIGIVSTIIFIIILIKDKIKDKTCVFFDYYGLTNLGFGLFLVFAVIGIVSIGTFISSVHQIIQDLTFPELTILDFVKQYLN